MPGWLQSALSIFGVLISGAALAISLRARAEFKTESLFRLRMEALLGLQECEIGWQSLLNDLRFHMQQLSSDGVSVARDHVLAELSGIEEFMRDALANSKKMSASAHEAFDTWSAENAKDALRYSEQGRRTLAHSRDEMTQKMISLGAALEKADEKRS